MKNLFAGILFVAIVLPTFFAHAATRVRGYYKPSNGRYVPSYYRSSPNRYRFDNYSSKGNYNPYTGKKGTADPFRPTFRR